MKKKIIKLMLGLTLDIIGVLPFFVPALGELFDLLWAPISAFMMMKMYKGRVGKVSSVISFLEEILPWTDIVPTFTLTWVYDLLKSKAH